MSGGGNMIISFECYGPVSEKLSRRGTIEVHNGITVRELIHELVAFNTEQVFKDYHLVINNKIADWDVTLTEQDKAVIFLPFAGG